MHINNNYNFPCVAFDFILQEKISFESYDMLESYIRAQLLSNDLTMIKDGLSNVLYWGYATSGGRQTHRVKTFRAEVKLEQLERFLQLIKNSKIGLLEIKSCGLPQFSNLSFITKILMFLDPEKYVVMDLQLAKLKIFFPESFFQNLVVHKTSIPVNKINVLFYETWCQFCQNLAGSLTLEIRAVDVERSIFQMVKENNLAELAKIFDNSLLNNAIASRQQAKW